MYQVIASDLDGTLLDGDHTASAFTAQTLQTLQARGIPLIIATGRHYCDVRGIRAALGIRAHLITSNGARIHDPDNQLMYARNIAPAIVREMMQPEFSEGASVNLYLDEEWLIGAPNERLMDMHKDSGFTYRVDDLPKHSGEGVAKVLYIAEPAHLAKIEARLYERFGHGLYITYSLPDCLEIMAPTVSKGHALQVVLDSLQLPMAHCVAFGDGLNDLDMLGTAGHPFMMANANAKLVALLPEVPQIGLNTDAAVALKLRELFKFDQ
ncbi:Cof-type HAD-IIB family hydrolase [Jeongeupia wiesaeckerbachi]|uniref:Cof-type HAD-IIB family hydrolase n=1 Tax=Jeongeupia wiesaeckerbachi TaxID=3051218 RepID=UPI003D804BF9